MHACTHCKNKQYDKLNRVGESTRLSNRIGRYSGSTSGRPVAQLGVRLCNRHPVTQPGGLRIRAEHIYRKRQKFGGIKVWRISKEINLAEESLANFSTYTGSL